MDPYADGTTLRAVPDHVATELDGELVVLQLETGTYYGVDGVGPFVWEQLQEPIAVGDLCERIVAEYDADRRRVEADVAALLADLEDARLVERANE